MIEHFGQEIVDWLTSLRAEDWRRYLFLLLSVYVAYRLMGWVLRSFMPWLLGRVVFPVAAGVVCLICVIMLVVQTLGVMPFRALKARPPGIAFGLGDMALGGMRRITAAVPYWANRVGFLRRVPRFLVVVILVTVAWYGHQIVCEAQPESQWCGRPAEAMNSFGDDAWERTVTTARDAFSR